MQRSFDFAWKVARCFYLASPCVALRLRYIGLCCAVLRCVKLCTVVAFFTPHLNLRTTTTTTAAGSIKSSI